MIQRYDYEIRVDDTLRRPVVIYITDCGRTVETLRGHNLEDTETEAREWIRERTPEGV